MWGTRISSDAEESNSRFFPFASLQGQNDDHGWWTCQPYRANLCLPTDFCQPLPCQLIRLAVAVVPRQFQIDQSKLGHAGVVALVQLDHSERARVSGAELVAVRVDAA